MASIPPPPPTPRTLGRFFYSSRFFHVYLLNFEDVLLLRRDLLVYGLSVLIGELLDGVLRILGLTKKTNKQTEDITDERFDDWAGRRGRRGVIML